MNESAKKTQTNSHGTPVILGLEEDVCARLLLELYAEPLGFSLRWFEQEKGWHTLTEDDDPKLLLLDLATFHGLREMERTNVLDKVFSADLYTLHIAGDSHELTGFEGIVAGRFTKPMRLEEFHGLLGDRALMSPEVSESTAESIGLNGKDDKPEEVHSSVYLDHNLRGFNKRLREFDMDAGMRVELAKSFMNRGTDICSKLQLADEAGETEVIISLSHEFKSMSGNLYFHGLEGLSKSLMDVARMGNLKEVPKLLEEIKKAFHRIKISLESDLGKSRE